MTDRERRSFAFADVARCTVLLVPILPPSASPPAAPSPGAPDASAATSSSCDPFVEVIRRCSSIRLGDVPPDPRGERATFSTTATTRGRLLFNFVTSSSDDHAFLSEFQVFRKLIGIIGVVDCRAWAASESNGDGEGEGDEAGDAEEDGGGLAAAQQHFEETVARYPRTLATRCYGFAPTAKQTDNVTGMVIVPDVGDTAFYVGTLLADFAGSILSEFSNMYASLESRTTVENPREQQIPNPFEFLPSRPSANSLISTYTNTKSTDPPQGGRRPSVQQPIRRASAPVTRTGTPTSPQQRQPSINMLSPGLALAPPSQARTALGIGGHQSGNQEGFLYGKNINSQPLVQAIANDASLASSVKARKRVAGRVRKLEGDLLLLGGRFSEAVSAFSDSISLSKNWADNLWHAAGLEALAVAKTLQVWSADVDRAEGTQHAADGKPASNGMPKDAAGVPYPSIALQNEILDLFSQAVAVYTKTGASPGSANLGSSTSGPPQPPSPSPDEAAHPLLVAECATRAARFSFCCWAHPTDTQAVLADAALGTWTAVASTSDLVARETSMLRTSLLGTAESSKRADMAGFANTAGTSLSSLGVHDRIRMLTTLDALYGHVGFYRKQGWVARELGALVAVVQGSRLPVNAFSTANGKARSSNSSAESLRTAVGSDGELRSSPVVLQNAPPLPVAGDRSALVDQLTALVDRACSAYGIAIGRDRSSVRWPGSARGWPSLKIGAVRDAEFICEWIGNPKHALTLSAIGLGDLSAFMDYDDQVCMRQDEDRVVAQAHFPNGAADIDYWGPPDLVQSVELAPLPPARTLLQLPSTASADRLKTALQTGPFLHAAGRDTGKPVATARDPLMAASEVAEFLVTLRNPLLFDLDINSLELLVEGLTFSAPSIVLTIPAGQTTTVRIVGTASSPGNLVVRGCRVRLTHCRRRDFLIPVPAADRAKARLLRNLHTRYDRPKSEHGGLHRPLEDDGRADERPERYLNCKVVAPTPLLRIVSTSLLQGGLMLYEGERGLITLSLENVSPVPVEWVQLHFTDTLTARVEAEQYSEAAQRRPAIERYDLENDMKHRPVFSWREAADGLRLGPRERATLTISCLGKLGCTGGTVSIVYSAMPAGSSEGVVARHLQQNVNLTVHRALEASGMLVEPCGEAFDPSELAQRTWQGRSVGDLMTRRVAVDASLSEPTKAGNNPNEHCVFKVDIKNVWGQSFNLMLEHLDDGEGNEGNAKVSQRLEPGLTATLIIRASRIILPAERSTQSIPTSTRQTAPARARAAEDNDYSARELFWYREELLRRLKCSWQEAGSNRSGSLSFRRMRLSPTTLAALRIEDVDVKLVGPSQAGPGETLELRAGEFHQLTAQVVNNAARSVKVTLHLQLEASPETASEAGSSTRGRAWEHLSRYILFDGATSVRLGAVPPGAEVKRTFAVSFLAAGRFDLGAEAAVDGDRGIVCRAQKLAVVCVA